MASLTQPTQRRAVAGSAGKSSAAGAGVLLGSSTHDLEDPYNAGNEKPRHERETVVAAYRDKDVYGLPGGLSHPSVKVSRNCRRSKEREHPVRTVPDFVPFVLSLSRRAACC